MIRSRTWVRLSAALAVGAFCLLAFAPGHHPASASIVQGAHTASSDTAACPPEANTCVSTSFAAANAADCTGTCTITAGPVSELGQGQAVYVEISGLATGDQVALAFCSLTSGTTPPPPPNGDDPTCASYLPPGSNCQEENDCNPTPSSLEWQYATASSPETVLSIGTEYDPNADGAQPITSETTAQYAEGEFGSFYCDNGPANPCGLEVMDMGINTDNVVGDGYPPSPHGPFAEGGGSTTQNTAIIPLNWASTNSGCQSAPIMDVDASYSVAQFLPAAGAATCNETSGEGVAVLPSDMPSVDDATCAKTGETHCPITDIVDGSAPVSFTDDPNDPATLATLAKAGGHFAYIPIAVSATEIAYEGQAGRTGASAVTYPISSYDLTPAQAAGIMTQLWTSPVAGTGAPQDDLCSQFSGVANCTETPVQTPVTVPVYTVNGDYHNVDVSTVDGGTAQTLPFTYLSYSGDYADLSYTNAETNYSEDTGYALLNPWPYNSGSAPATESNLDAMFPSTGSGASYETTGWICGAPNLNYSVDLPWGGSAMVSDLESGQQVLANAEEDPIEMNSNGTEEPIVSQSFVSDPSGCKAVSSLPTNFASTTASNGLVSAYSPSSEPLTAAHVIQGVIRGDLLGLAFTAMDSSEADFFGLLPANLENAAGQFVGPSASAISAGLGDETVEQNGTLEPNFDDTTDAAAYPMPMVTYALISTSPQPSAQQATELSDLLTNLVHYSNTGGANSSNPLPPGYVPLPNNLYQEAVADISKDVIGPNGQPVSPAPVSTSPPASSVTAANSSTPTTAGEGSSGSYGGVDGAAYKSDTKGSITHKSATTNSGSSSGSSDGLNPVGRLLVVTLGDNRFLVPALLLLALLCLVFGPLLYMYPALRKPSVAEGAGPDLAGDAGGSPPDPDS